MNFPIIGIAGKARSGKDTAAEFLMTRGVCKYRYAFADPIRAMLKAGFGIDMSDPAWLARKEAPIARIGKSPRKMMQTLGTEWGRELVNRDVWIIAAQMQLERHGKGMLISDVRFDNEAHWIRLNGGLVIHLSRPTGAPVAPHASEGGIGFETEDVEVLNDGDIETLHNRLLFAVGWGHLIRERA